ncbi:MAG TPA: carboxypeptidase regulatory-like domain-containing protein [Terriglobales bacterium]|nr:carboxypeptidase regulatory-like domain-containing protein [Terriglobales bacterium]
MRTVVRALCLVALFAAAAFASINGSISGIVTDSSGAVVTGATVTAVNVQTGIKSTSQTDTKGFYSFPSLPIGTYDVEIQEAGFKSFTKTGLILDANSALRADATLPVGTVSEKVEVQSNAVQVETQSTQLGEVIDGKKITSVPLNGRSYTDLLSLQPGVVPSAYGGQAPDTTDHSPSGALNPGNQSVNGQREQSNGFMVNGSNVEEGKNNGAAVIPNLDSIAEFRIITNNFDAEYGNYSGGQINVATKSGTNKIHGDIFEFFRNTAMDATQYFATTVPVFIQNQFGGTVGGPIKKDKMFFFIDYQGTRQITSSPTTATVPSALNQSGDFSDQVDNLTGSVNGSYFAQLLSGRLGYAVTDGEAYYTPGCTSATCVFPNAVIPQTAWSPVATSVIGKHYIPLPNSSSSGFNYLAPDLRTRLRDDKGGLRIDDNTQWGTLSAYYVFDDFHSLSPFQNSSINIPGFGAVTPGRAQLLTLSDTKTIGTTAVNQFQFSYVRNAQTLNKPQGGLGVSLASLGFVTPAGGTFNGGIAPIDPALAGVPAFVFNQFSFGTPVTTTGQFNNMFQWQDNYSKVIGTHSIKFGGSFHYDQINERNFFGENGNFTFDGTETGVDFADFLIGATDGFIQASRQLLDSRSRYIGLYVQDSWRIKPSLTFNYGLRWEESTPFYDTGNKTETIVPGLQSVLFPGAPKGFVVPGDPGIPRTLAPVKHNAFSPRIGLAYSPNSSEGLWGKITGGPGKTSIRTGFGMFYTALEDLTQFQEVGDPPYGLFWAPNTNPLLETPFIDRPSGVNEGQRFPFQLPPSNVSAKNPDTAFNWNAVTPLSGDTSFYYKNRLPYAEHYELSIQRELSAHTVLSVAYVGTQGHKLLTFMESNPGNAALCLFLSDPTNLAPNSPTCGRHGEDPGPGAPIISAKAFGPYPAGTSFATTRLLTGLNTPGTDNFQSSAYEKTVANSAYNSLQASLRHESSRASFLLGYTYSKSMDNSSGLEDPTDVFDPRRSRGLSLFDLTHNFVGSYTVSLPFEKLASNGTVQKIIGGWQLSGITTFATGLPINLTQGQDRSLTGAIGVNKPDFVGGKVLNNTDPRSGQAYFNPAAFAPEPLGQIGTSNRRFFHGPGLNNFDMALLRNIAFTESKELQLRFEAFNVFNHAQFTNPDGNIADTGTFGFVSGSRPARILQIAGKFVF